MNDQPSQSERIAELTTPLGKDVLTVEGEARRLPSTGRFDNEGAMRTWLKSSEPRVFRARLMSKSAAG